MAKSVMRMQWDQTSLLWALHANVNRDAKKRPKPYLPSDVHPLRTDDEIAENESPDWAMIALLKQQFKVTKLNHGRQGD